MCLGRLQVRNKPQRASASGLPLYVVRTFWADFVASPDAAGCEHPIEPVSAPRSRARYRSSGHALVAQELVACIRREELLPRYPPKTLSRPHHGCEQASAAVAGSGCTSSGIDAMPPQTTDARPSTIVFMGTSNASLEPPPAASRRLRPSWPRAARIRARTRRRRLAARAACARRSLHRYIDSANIWVTTPTNTVKRHAIMPKACRRHDTGRGQGCSRLHNAGGSVGINHRT